MKTILALTLGIFTSFSAHAFSAGAISENLQLMNSDTAFLKIAQGLEKKGFELSEVKHVTAQSYARPRCPCVDYSLTYTKVGAAGITPDRKSPRRRSASGRCLRLRGELDRLASGPGRKRSGLLDVAQSPETRDGRQHR